MPSNYTPNYQLSQWEAGDAVLREDFNADNRKIEKALNERSYRVIDFIHTGLGDTSVEFTPYRRAMVVFLVGDGYSLMMVRPADKAVCVSATGQTALVNVTWTKYGVSWSAANGDPAFTCNKIDTDYACTTILSLEEE